jgi:hypothetical protein
MFQPLEVSKGWNPTMKPSTSKQRPSFPAVAGAGASLLAGLFCFSTIYQRVESGTIGREKLAALVLVSLATTTIFVFAVPVLGLSARHSTTRCRK